MSSQKNDDLKRRSKVKEYNYWRLLGILVMAKTEVYQIRLDSDEKKLAFAVFRQLGLTPAQAIRMFFRQVVLTQSIPFQIESKSIQPSLLHTPVSDKSATVAENEENHHDIFTELDQILNADKK